MSIEKKLSRLKKTAKSAETGLLKLVVKKAKKKKILKKVAEIQSLDKNQKKLEKKLKSTLNDRKPKAKSEKGASKEKSSKAGKKSNVKKGEKTVNATAPADKKENESWSETGFEEETLQESNELNAKDAIEKIQELNPNIVKEFVKNETRKTVLAKAESRISDVEGE